MLKSSTDFASALSAAVGGIVSTLALYPLEIVKNNLQVGGGGSGGSNDDDTVEADYLLSSQVCKARAPRQRSRNCYITTRTRSSPEPPNPHPPLRYSPLGMRQTLRTYL